MRTIPDMTVIVPCDANETREAVRAMIAYDGPCYFRTSRVGGAEVTKDTQGYQFTLGKGAVLMDGKDVTIIACGLMVQKALEAAERLGKEGISVRVIDMHTIKPLDKELILRSAEETGAIVTAEEHNVIGGLGAAVAEVIVKNNPIPVEMVGVEDQFGRSGPGEELLRLYGLTTENIMKKTKKAIGRK